MEYNNTINDPIIASSPNVQNVNIIGSTGTQKVEFVNGIDKPNSKPDYWDTTSSSTIIYEGYKTSTNLILSKIDLTLGTRTWGIDSWANRLVAVYS